MDELDGTGCDDNKTTLVNGTVTGQHDNHWYISLDSNLGTFRIPVDDEALGFTAFCPLEKGDIVRCTVVQNKGVEILDFKLVECQRTPQLLLDALVRIYKFYTQNKLTDEFLIQCLSCDAYWIALGSCDMIKHDIILKRLLQIIQILHEHSSHLKSFVGRMIKILAGTTFLQPLHGPLRAYIEKKTFNVTHLQILCYLILEKAPKKAGALVKITEPLCTIEDQRVLKLLHGLFKHSIPAELYLDDEDWNSLPLVPTLKEIEGGFVNKHYLQPVKIGRPYVSVAEYTDTYFRLLRADCFNGICSGIYQYLRGRLNERDMRIHKDLQIVGIHMNIFQRSVVLVVQKPANTTYYGKLMYGSLLCLSVSGRFDDPMWATIVDSDIEIKGCRGYLSIELVSEYNSSSTGEVIQLLCASGSFVMAESPAYYRSYQPVFLALKDMDSDKIPFMSSLVHAQMPNPPTYSRRNEECAPLSTLNRFVMSRKVNNSKLIQTIKEDLDTSQAKAFQLALENEIAIIQGPPGTGKTYIGSKLVEAFITMSEGIKLPIMVVSYKNRALDEFLEHIYPLCPNGIARIGRTSANSKIKECNLSELKKLHRMPQDIFKQMRELRREADGFIWKIKELTNKLQSSLYFDACLIINWLNYQQKQMLQRKKGNQDIAFIIKQWLPDQTVFEGIKNKLQVKQQLVAHSTEMKTPMFQEEQMGIDVDEEILERWAALDDDRHTKMNAMSLFNPSEAKIKLWPNVEEKLFSMPPTSLLNIEDPWELTLVQRVYVIQYLLLERSHFHIKELEKYIALYEENSEARRELDNLHKANILREKMVIGLTVTGACINKEILKQVNPEIIIVEEAAEILESHLIALLGNSVKHLILIGDHQQLKPQVDHELEREYSFNISMMERLIRNKLPYATLQMQNRMRPEFAELLKDIYPDLKNHPRVTQNKLPKCMEKSMFFWTHNSPEIPGRSCKNEGEATRAVYLALFFLSQGYCAGQITILAAYQKQVQLLREKVKSVQKEYKSLFENQSVDHANPNSLKVHTIDNFQGDENEIVIVSLVRSNDENKIGFLNKLNRRCVAQSRAKCGMYFIGNHEVFVKDKNWLQLLCGMHKSKCLGFQIILQCPNHQDVSKVQATDAKDIKHILHGFCKEKCGHLYKCGKHQCKEPCGSYHDHKFCKAHTNIIFSSCGHKFTTKCFKATEVKVCEREESIRLQCGHIKKVKCYEKHDVNNLVCLEKCGKKLPCTHLCDGRCGEPCNTTCEICFKLQKFKNIKAREEERKKIEKELKDVKRWPNVKYLTTILPDGDTASDYYFVHDRVLKYIQPMHNWKPTVTKIEKLVNTELQIKFTEVKLKLFDPASPPQYLFHGTSSKAMVAILNNGFKLPERAGMYGAGIYVATDSSKSQRYSSSSQLLLCQVLLGKVLTLKTADPNMNLQTLKTKGYDSVFAPRDTKHTGGVLNDEFVVFRPEQVLPLFVVHYI